jgi:MoaA/NifB/PqqE/SkfB family radical SAM enzyme
MITGINVKESNNELIVGIKLEEFIAALQQLPSKAGWVNIIITPRKEIHPKGYTHFIKPEKKKQP